MEKYKITLNNGLEISEELALFLIENSFSLNDIILMNEGQLEKLEGFSIHLLLEVKRLKTVRENQ